MSFVMDKVPQAFVVVKLGGAEGLDFSAICSDVVRLIEQGQQIILVHGGSNEANQLGQALGSPARFITSPSGFTSRYTDRHTLEIFIMAVNGKINTFLVEQLQQVGVNAFGLSGLDGRMMVAVRKEAVHSIEDGKRKIIRDDFTGKVERVDAEILRSLLALGRTPVISPLAAGLHGEALNVDADRAAATVAVALQAETLVMLTAVPGLLQKYPDEKSLIRDLPAAHINKAYELAQGRMKKKILGAEEALQGGVGRVIIADGRCEKPLIHALAGIGTVIA